MKISRLLDNQIIGENADMWGLAMRSDLLLKGIDTIDAGTILIARYSAALNIMFEANAQIRLFKVRGVDIVYATPGSKVFMRQSTQDIAAPTSELRLRMESKNICFRDCRLPTAKEYNVYRYTDTV